MPAPAKPRKPSRTAQTPAAEIVDIREFRARARRGEAAEGAVRTYPVLRLLETASDQADDSRVVSFVFSDDSVDRYGDTIDQRGWVLDSYRANPVVLFGHNDKQAANVVGKVLNLRVEGNRLIGDVEFAAADVNPEADVVFRLVKGGFLNCVSVGFQPLEWALSKDKSRPGGVDFRKQELLELSIVPVPANANALVQVRAAGIAASRVALGMTAARDPDIREIKGLYEVSWLACLLADLSWLEEMVEWEADYEGDDSPVPAMLTQALQQLGATLVAMTEEEVAELLAEEDAEKSFPAVARKALETRQAGGSAKGPSAKASVLQPGETVLTMSQVSALIKGVFAGDLSANTARAAAAVTRQGKVLSAANEQTLRDAHGMIAEGCAKILGLIGEPDEGGEGEGDTETKAAAARRRRAAALRLKHGNDNTPESTPS
ncbi:HK97 family phage prohead protease [Xanthobacter flavus]|uniref:HK97 family phage prohead protease n=1 Tax=Xanthobacter flavus TaxID=281 RepID=UPI003728D4F7